MKKIIFTALFFVLFVSAGWARNFELPPVTNTVESIREGFLTLIQNAKNLGIIEWERAWNYSPETMTRRHIEYLENVLTYMAYEKVRDYVATIRANIDSLDRLSLSRSAEANFERFLNGTNPNHNFEVRGMMSRFSVRPFPPEIVLNYDRSRLEDFDLRVRQDEACLPEYRRQLEELLSATAQLNARSQAIQDELRTPRLSSQRRQQLNNEETNILHQVARANGARVNLTDRIRGIERRLSTSENDRARLARSLEEPAQRSFVSDVFASLYNFHSWEAFFNGESSCIRDFLILNNARANLSQIIDRIPQRDAPAYEARVDALLAGWGL